MRRKAWNFISFTVSVTRGTVFIGSLIDTIICWRNHILKNETKNNGRATAGKQEGTGDGDPQENRN